MEHIILDDSLILQMFSLKNIAKNGSGAHNFSYNSFWSVILFKRWRIHGDTVVVVLLRAEDGKNDNTGGGGSHKNHIKRAKFRRTENLLGIFLKTMTTRLYT